MKIDISICCNTSVIYKVILFLACCGIMLPVSAHWNSKGPYGGSVTALAVADTNLYVATKGGGVFRSRDKSATSWRAVNTGLESGSITALASHGSMLYAATSDAGIFVSSDLGNTWTSINNGLNNLNVRSLLVTGNAVYAGTSSGLYKRIISGNTWSYLESFSSTKAVTCFAEYAGIIYAGTLGEGVWTTTNEGNDWSSINTGLTSSDIYTLAIHNNLLIAGTANGVYSSPASTINWQLIGSGIENRSVYALLDHSSLLYSGTDNGVFVYEQESESWRALTTNLLSDTVCALAFFENNLWAGTSGNGIYKAPVASLYTTANWSQQNLGLNNLKTIALCASGNLIVGATERGVFVSRDLAASYILSNNGLKDSLHLTSLVLAGTKLYAGTKLGGVYISADTGRSWHAFNEGLSSLSIAHLMVTSDKIFAALTNGRVYVSSLSDIEWTTTSNLPDDILISGFAVNGTDVFAGTLGAGVFKCTDGATWEAFNEGLTNLNITALAVLNNKLFVAASDNGIFVSDVLSASWVYRGDGLPTNRVTSLGVTGKYLLVGYRGGIHVTSDNGVSWQAPNVQLHIPGYADVTSFAFTDSRIFIGTPGNSFYSNSKSELPPVSVTSITSGKSFNTIDFTIAPNPSSGSFAIEWNTHTTGTYPMAIYSSIGTLIELIEVENSSVIKRNYPKGVYYIKVLTDEYIFSEKLIID